MAGSKPEAKAVAIDLGRVGKGQTPGSADMDLRPEYSQKLTFRCRARISNENGGDKLVHEAADILPRAE